MDDQTRDEYQAEVRQLRADLAAARSGEGLHVAPKPPPLRQAEVIRLLLEAQRVRAAGGERSTVRLTRNAKGDVQPEVYVGTGDSDELLTIDDVAAKAVAVFDSLCLLYPLAPVEVARGSTKPAKPGNGDAQS